MLEIPYGTCYSKTKEEQLPTSGCPHKQWLEKSTLVTRSKFWGGFSMLRSLSDKRKYECQQCKNEHTKSHKVFEIKMIIVHKHHLHSM